MVIQIVLYDIPGRDCMRRAAPGELTVDPVDQTRYRTAFVDPIVQILGRAQYAGLRIVAVVEPGAMPGVLFDRSQGFLECETARTSNVYVDAVRTRCGG
jgi:cellulose 1,4-beta-cellobiosidase